MKPNYLTLPEDPTEVLRGCFWAVATGAPFVFFIVFAWLGIQRTEILFEHRWRIAAQIELENERRMYNAAIADLNQRLAKAEAAQRDAEEKANAAMEGKTRAEMGHAWDHREAGSVDELHAVPANDPQVPVMADSQATSAVTVAETPAVAAMPSTAEITEFIKLHLGRMTGPVVGQLVDYAEDTDFHDKLHASLQTIANDRLGWAQRWPRRVIYKDEIVPEVVLNRDPYFSWVATAQFTWRWLFWSRSGSPLQGVYRDTWKIIPGAAGFKIVSEHSVDAATGRSRD